MKYLFFFNGQLLLLCCMCCKIAIQDFVTRLHKKNKKNLRFHRRVHRRPITRRYFTESWKQITGVYHNHRRPITRRYFTKSSKKLRECATITDGSADGFTEVYYRRTHRRNTHNPNRTHVRHVSVVQMYRRIKKSGGIYEIFWCAYQLIDGITDGI